MAYSSKDFEHGNCPHCGSHDVDEEHNLANIGFLGGAGYFLDFPFGADYTCKKCGTKNTDDECFVATAVYGDAHAPQVEALRTFRDMVLKNSAPGRAFIELYYSGTGKKAAHFIKEHVPSAIPVISKGLDALVERISAKKA
jgi:hypothetical protein